MINPPRTKEEAATVVYGAGCFKYPHVARKCAYPVRDKVSGDYFQCCRNSSHGPDSLYCKQHAKIVEGKP